MSWLFNKKIWHPNLSGGKNVHLTKHLQYDKTFDWLKWCWQKKKWRHFPNSFITTHWRDWWAVLNLTLVYSLFGSNLFQVYSKFMQVCMWARAFSYSLFGSNLSSIYSLRFQIYSRENNVLSTIYLLRLDSIFSDQSKKKGIAAGRFGWLSARIWRTLSQRIHNKLSHKKLVKKLQFELRLKEIEMELMKRKEVTEDPVFYWALFLQGGLFYSAWIYSKRHFKKDQCHKVPFPRTASLQGTTS